MAFEGDLRNISLADIFQSLTMNRQVGTLVVRCVDREKQLVFDERGLSLASRRTIEGFRLGEFLVGRGLITEANLSLALMRQRKSGAPLGEVLIEGGAIEPAHVEDVLRYHAAEEIYELFEWEVGSFQFLENDSSARESGAQFVDLYFDPNHIVLEAARRVDETAALRETIPSDDDFYISIRPPFESEADDIDLQNLLALLDGTRAIRDLFTEFYLGKFDVMQGIDDLRRAGLAESLDSSRLVAVSEQLLTDKQAERAKRALERANEFSPDDPEILRRLADACRAAQDPTAAGEWICRLASLRETEQQHAVAVTLYREALDVDSKCLNALTALAWIALSQKRYDDAVDMTIRRVNQLRERRRHAEGADVCWELLELPQCRALELRIVLGNCLASERRNAEAIDAFEEAAAQAEAKGSKRHLVDIFKRIVALDADRRDLVKRIHDMEAGEAAVRRRKTMMIGSAAAALILAGLGFLVLRPSTDFEDGLAEVDVLISAGRYTDATEMLLVFSDRWPDDPERLAQIDTIKSQVAAKIAAGQRPINLCANRLEKYFRPLDEAAVTHFEEGRPHEALAELTRAAAVLSSPDAEQLKALDPARFKAFVRQKSTIIETRVREGLTTIARQLDDDRIFVRSIEKKELYRETRELRPWYAALREAQHRYATIRIREIVDAAEIIAKAIRNSSVSERAQRLEERHRELAPAISSAASLEHEVRALIYRGEILTTFRDAMNEARRDRDAGRFEPAKNAIGKILDLFAEIEAVRPAEPYRPVLRFVEERGLRADAETVLINVDDMLGRIDQGRKDIARGRYAEAQVTYLKLLADYPVVDFRRHITLPLNITSRPSGAQVTVNGKTMGTTPILLHLDYVDTSEVVISMPTFREAKFRIEGAHEPGDAQRHLDLDKIPRWTRDLSLPVERGVALGKAGILVATRGRSAFVIDPSDGVVTRTIETKRFQGVAGRPVVDGDATWVTTVDGHILRIGLASENILDIPIADALYAGPALSDGRVIVTDSNGRLIARSTEGDHEELWSVELGGRVLEAPLIVGKRVYVATTTGKLLARDVETGTELWTRDVGASVRHTPTHADGRLFLATDAGYVWALDAESGEPLWSERVRSSATAPALVHGGQVHVATQDGRIHRLAATDGKPADPIEVGSPIGSAMVEMEGRLYGGTQSGQICSFDLATGKLVWSYQLGGPVIAAPFRSGDAIIAVARHGRLAAFDR